MEDHKAALIWITDILKENGIPFQITGGLAAIAYGAERTANDIDIYIPMDRFFNLGKEIEEYRIWGPAHQKDEHWDTTYARLLYQGINIELADAYNTKLYDSSNKRWVPQRIDFSNPQYCRIWGVLVPVMPKVQLIEYKSILGRDVDKEDINQILD